MKKEGSQKKGERGGKEGEMARLIFFPLKKKIKKRGK
jgi:hypothetical protein